MGVVTKAIHRTFRYEWIAWIVLALLCAATQWLALPNLQYRFSFKDIFDSGHPARVEYEAFLDEFELGPGILVYFHGPTVFEAGFLAQMSELSSRLERMSGVEHVLSPLSLLEPEIEGNHVRLRRILRPAVYDDPERLRNTLNSPPFANRWHKLLYDETLGIFAMIVTPNVDQPDPRESVAFMGKIEDAIRTYAARAGCEFHLSGLFFMTQEVIRVTANTQRRLVSLTAVMLFFVLWALFGSARASLQLFLLLGISIYLGFGVMAATGIPMNFMSTNFPLMILVVGTADIIHILAFYANFRSRYSPRGAAIRAARRTLLPNLLTTGSTIGCIYFTSLTDLSILKQFSLALCLGIFIVYLVTIVYGPLLFRRSGLRAQRGLFWTLRRLLLHSRRPWLTAIRSRVLLGSCAAIAVGSIAVARTQQINSNWFRKFTDDQRLPQTQSFLRSQDMPLSAIDCTLDAKTQLRDLVADDALQADVQRISTLLRGLPDVHAVFTALSTIDFVAEQVGELAFPADLDSAWVGARKQALLRTYLAAGAFDEYLSAHTGRLRLVALADVEDSARFLALRDELLEGVKALPLESVQPEDLRVTGQMIYWSQIMASIPDTFLKSLWGSALIVLLSFLLMTRRGLWAIVALVPNVMPVIIMIAAARLLGWELTDNLCFLVSLSIGIAVDDTLHFVYHFHAARKRGMDGADAAQHTLATVGTAIVVTSVLLTLGFAICLSADITTVQVIGVLIMISILSALLLDLFMLPALLLRLSPEKRG